MCNISFSNTCSFDYVLFLQSKVWISFAQFELSINPEDPSLCRAIYREANKSLQTSDEKEERLMLLESWKEFEVQLFAFLHVRL